MFSFYFFSRGWKEGIENEVAPSKQADTISKWRSQDWNSEVSDSDLIVFTAILYCLNCAWSGSNRFSGRVRWFPMKYIYFSPWNLWHLYYPSKKTVNSFIGSKFWGIGVGQGSGRISLRMWYFGDFGTDTWASLLSFIIHSFTKHLPCGQY